MDHQCRVGSSLVKFVSWPKDSPLEPFGFNGAIGPRVEVVKDEYKTSNPKYKTSQKKRRRKIGGLDTLLQTAPLILLCDVD